MPTTLTDEQIAELRQRLSQAETNKQIAEAAAGAWNHPEYGEQAKALWKKVYPDTSIPDYDLEQRITKRLEERDKRDEEERKAARDREIDERITTERQKVKDRYGATDDAIGRLEKLMNERGIGDYEVAAEYMFSREPKVSDGSQEYDSQFWAHEKQDLFKEIASDPEGWGRREILKTLREGERRNSPNAW